MFCLRRFLVLKTHLYKSLRGWAQIKLNLHRRSKSADWLQDLDLARSHLLELHPNHFYPSLFGTRFAAAAEGDDTHRQHVRHSGRASCISSVYRMRSRTTNQLAQPSANNKTGGRFISVDQPKAARKPIKEVMARIGGKWSANFVPSALWGAPSSLSFLEHSNWLYNVRSRSLILSAECANSELCLHCWSTTLFVGVKTARSLGRRSCSATPKLRIARVLFK